MKILIFFCCIFSFNSGLLLSQTSWLHTNGPQGSILSGLYSNEKFAFIAEQDFLFRTADGIHWEKIEHTGPYLLATHKDTLLHPLYNSLLHKMRLQVSTDNGDSWIIKDLPELITSYESLAMYNHGIYWVQASKNLLFRSTDLGTTWDTIFHPFNFSYDLNVFDETLYANDLGQIWRTGDGVNWEQVLTPNDPMEREYIDDFVVKDSNIMFTTEELLFYSNDDGNTWTKRPAHSRNSYDKITLVGNDVYFQYDGYLFRTSDFGRTWDTLSADLNILSLITFTGGTGVFLASSYNKGVFRWDDSADDMLESNVGLTKGFIYDLDYGDHKIWAACGNGIFAYDISSKTWGDKMDLPLPVFEYTSVSANEDGWVVALPIYGDSLYISHNQGQSWNTIHTDFYMDRLQFLGDHLFAFDDGYGLFRSLDHGEHWESMHLGSYDDNMVLFKGKYYLLGYDSIYYTVDEGITWNSITNPIDIIELYSDGDHLYGMTIDTSGYIDLSISDDGSNWIYAGTGFPDINYFDFIDIGGTAFFFRDEEHYYAFMGDYGHYISPIDNIVWTPLETTQTGSDYLIHDNVAYLGNEGMYTSEILDPFITKTNEPSCPLSVSVFPVPAKDFLNISLKEHEFSGTIHFLLYNANGKLVKSLISEPAPNIMMNIRDISPGIYFLKVQTSGKIGVVKILKQ